MNGKKLTLVALSATLLVGAAVTSSFAAPGGNGHGQRHRPGFPPEITYVRMVKQFDANGDMKVSKDELKAGVDKIYDQIDANHDGQVTPAELRTYRQDRIKAWRDEHKKDVAQNDENGAAPQDGAHGPRHHGMHGQGPHGGWQRARVMQVVMFNRIDADGNGQISKQEAEDAANKFFDRIDRNHDGVLSIDDMPNRPFL